jgi:hypothetical protein
VKKKIVIFICKNFLLVVLKKNNKNYKNLYQKIGVIKWIMKKLKKKSYTGKDKKKKGTSFVSVFFSI